MPTTAARVYEAKIDTAANGNNVIVAAETGKAIKVLRLFFVANAAVTVRFRDGVSDDLTGPIDLQLGGSFVLDMSPDERAWFTTTAGNAFVLNLSGAAQVSGRIYYRLQ